MIYIASLLLWLGDVFVCWLLNKVFARLASQSDLSCLLLMDHDGLHSTVTRMVVGTNEACAVKFTVFYRVKYGAGGLLIYSIFHSYTATRTIERDSPFLSDTIGAVICPQCASQCCCFLTIDPSVKWRNVCPNSSTSTVTNTRGSWGILWNNLYS